MTTITIDIPDGKAKELSKYVTKIGGHVVVQESKEEITDTDEDEVTHGEFFGENIKRAINILKKR
jgi:hypothetical protein